MQNKFEKIISHKIITILVFILNLCIFVYSSYALVGNLLLLVLSSPLAMLFCDHPIGGKVSFGNCTGITMVLLMLFPIVFSIVSMVLIFFKKQNKRILAIAILLVNVILTLYLSANVLAVLNLL